MTTEDELAAAEARVAELRKRRHEEYVTELRAKPLIDRLVFAAYMRCPCGAGLAYDPAGEDRNGQFVGPSHWDCSAILLGTAIPAGQPGSVQHCDWYPFAFYEIKSENQPSAHGATTRPKL